MPKKKKKKNWVSKLKKGVQSILKGPGHSPAGKKHLKKQTAKGLKLGKKGKATETIATKGVERRLRAAGLTDAEIKKLR